MPGYHTHAASLEELMLEIREAIELCLGVQDREPPTHLEFIGIQRVTVAA
ncbi:MAG: type II toxin-antitoxin system HicB family antitoxin [Bryobacteraceae bacterium]|nr:type II toxin-antitoxin system HicB family antitoxin [Bryobacteraceae bacterium]